MMSEEEECTMHSLEAIIKYEIVWKLFVEAIRVTRLNYREYATQHFKNRYAARTCG